MRLARGAQDDVVIIINADMFAAVAAGRARHVGDGLLFQQN